MPTEEEIKAQAAVAAAELRIAEIANQAVTAQLKRFEKSQGDSFSKMLDEKLKAFVPVPPPAQPGNDEEHTKGGNKKASPEMAAMQAKLDELAKITTEAQARATKAESDRREEATFGAVRGYLKDVRPELQEVAARDLFYSQKRVIYDENGKPLFRGRRIPAPGMAEEEVELPLQDGIAQWLKSKEAAPFLPPPHHQSSTRTGARSPNADGLAGSKRGPNGLPVWDTEASTDEEKVIRAMETEAAVVAIQGREGRS